MTLSSFRSRRNRCASGFTLVELLVVIGIIAILAAIVSVNIKSFLNAAKRAQANVVMSQIQTAVTGYYTEYSVYPTDAALAGGTDAYYGLKDDGSAKWKALTIALCGNINPTDPSAVTASTVPNTHGIAYLTPKRSDLDTDGAIRSPFSTTNSPSYFALVMDTNYDNLLGNPASGTNLPDFAGASGKTAISGNTSTTGGTALWCNCEEDIGQMAVKTVVAHWIHTY